MVALAGRLRAAGVEVQCLGGDLGWLDRPDWARQWLARALIAWGFDAVHLDVEVWRAPGWEDDRVRLRLLEQYLTLLRTVREAGLPLEVDVAPRLAGDLAGTKRVLDAVLDPADRVTVMAYRNHAEDGRLVLDREAAVVANHLTGNPLYLGVAVHDWHHWRRLARAADRSSGQLAGR